MVKKATEPVAEAVETAETPTVIENTVPQKGKEPDGCAAGFYCYIGPNLAGLIQHGTIYRGSRADALAAAAAAVEKNPLVKTLIVSGDELPQARLKVKKPGNALYQNYQRVAGEGRK